MLNNSLGKFRIWSTPGTYPVVASAVLTFTKEGSYNINALIIQVKKGEISVTEKKYNIVSLQELRQFLPKNVPLIIGAEGRGILHKKYPIQEQPTQQGIVRDMLPNARQEEFYIQQYKTEKAVFYSIVRKETIETLLQELVELKIPLVGLSLLPTSVAPAITALLPHEHQVSLPGFKLSMENGHIEQFTINREENRGKLTIGEDEIDHLDIYPYLMSVPYLVNLPKVEVAPHEVGLLRDNFFYKNIFEKAGWVTLCFFLVGLLVNFFVYTSLQSENQQLTVRLGAIRKGTDRLETLEKELSEKKAFLQTAGWLYPSHISIHADRIGNTVPLSVKLTAMEIFPVNRKTGQDQNKELFERQMIVLKGVIKKPTELNDWIKELDKLENIADANVATYTFDTKSGQGEFIIHLTLQNLGL